MSELIDTREMGPLDRMEVAVNQALRYDDMLLHGQYDEPGQPSRSAIHEQVESLTTLFPLVGHEFSAGGEFIVPHINDGEALADTTSTSEGLRIKGLYRGFRVLDVASAMLAGEFVLQPRVVHVIETPAYTTESAHERRIVFPRYCLLVRGADMQPLEVYDSHSLLALRGDRIKHNLEELLTADCDPGEVLKGINELLLPTIDTSDATSQELLRQRLSYINSLGWFNGKTALSPEAVIQKPNQNQPFDYFMSDSDPMLVDDLRGLELHGKLTIAGNKIVVQSQRQFYLRGCYDGYAVLLPYSDKLLLQ